MNAMSRYIADANPQTGRIVADLITDFQYEKFLDALQR